MARSLLPWLRTNLARGSRSHRRFSTTAPTFVKNLQVSESRLWESIQKTCEIAGARDGGLCRLSLDDNDKIARDWFAEEAKQMGCRHTVDTVGTQWVTLDGENNDVPPIAIGSHLDTVSTGGKFDGCLGVLAGLEVLRVLHASGYKTFAPITAINWTNEEANRFLMACSGSSVWSGETALDAALRVPDVSQPSITFGNELKRIGYNGTAEASYRARPLSAHFELHVEQGRRLEQAGKEVGVVYASRGMRYYQVALRGALGHVSMRIDRKDALVGAASIILEIERIGRATEGTTTTTMFSMTPQDIATIPNATNFTFGTQYSNASIHQEVEDHLIGFIEKAAADRGLEVTVDHIAKFDSTVFDETLVSCVEQSAKDMGYNYLRMESHALHDSMYIQKVCPSAMIFTPSRDGISHSPLEYSSPENCKVGAQTVLGAVLEYDAVLRAKYSKRR
ncbi:hypothetical protein PV04_01781 [Phialophora macrospora]|uniref:Peptidase M20 dimerisation domain-containing protein n=1 Tax=Phialophora macrospora TaxID=1851006 RepID=A0A0D2FYQ1_9EURO|nr:hypothetical protein PV04_01781 [Phialophora macrospora]